ncbi:TetR/AcrR family transcriptional regulator [Elioraea sp.]|uniref:TetR/AcrR family transcriptional regulator n=1 Tax=Elioraea sp. TaxID=2185103 RepID=UPI0025BF46B7|nr:TetR/AcrR family transcriptional regulator [Elioraea sp.]
MSAARSETVDGILDAAERRVRRGGFAAASFRDLAADVGIRSASVHYYFAQKADLGRALVDRYADRFIDALGPPSGADARDRLIGAYMAGFGSTGAATGAACLCAMLGAARRDLPEPVAAAVAAFYERLVGWATEALGSAEDAEFAIAALQGAMVLAVARDDAATLGRAAARVAQALDQRG